MKVYNSMEVQKALEKITKELESSKRSFPIEWSMEGRRAVPVLAKQEEIKDEDKIKSKIKTVEVNLGNIDDGEGYIKAKIKIEKYTFLDASGNESFIELPVIADTGKELLEGAKGLTDIFIAMRNTVLLATAIHPMYVANSSFKPETGVILADILGNNGRVQSGTVKEIIEASDQIDPNKINSIVSEYNGEKGSKHLIESIGYLTAVKFRDGLNAQIAAYEKIEARGVDNDVIPQATNAEPVVVDRKETKMTHVERRESKSKSIKSLL
ncbi:MAG: hypothetical protein ACRCX8_16810 [Sarcina sp.]